MSRSFQIVEQKISEADFFLSKLEQATSGLNLFESQNYLSAFLSASRSITFCIQSSIFDLAEFENWYSGHQEKLGKNNLTRYFLFARNHSQKVGFYPIGGGKILNDEKGNRNAVWFFTPFYPDDKEIIPEIDVVAACKEYLKTLLKIVLDCYRVFGTHIDPDQYYTIGNLTKLGLTVEDVEEELGFPRGWTNIENSSEEERLTALSKQYHTEGVDHILLKYLGVNRVNQETN